MTMPMIQIETQPFVQTKTKTKPLTMPQIQTLTEPKTQIQIQTKTLTEPKTQTQIKTQPLTLTALQPLVLTKTQTAVLTKTTTGVLAPSIEQLFTGGEQGFRPQVLKRQYKDGRRIRGKEWIDLTPHSYTHEDALAIASHTADNTAKRSIRVVPTDQKPRKRPRSINPWTDQMFEYKDKGRGIFVETNMFAIDSPGEIREISQRGWEARRKPGSNKKTSTKSQGFSLKTPSMKGIENKIKRRFMK